MEQIALLENYRKDVLQNMHNGIVHGEVFCDKCKRSRPTLSRKRSPLDQRSVTHYLDRVENLFSVSASLATFSKQRSDMSSIAAGLTWDLDCLGNDFYAITPDSDRCGKMLGDITKLSSDTDEKADSLVNPGGNLHGDILQQIRILRQKIAGQEKKLPRNIIVADLEEAATVLQRMNTSIGKLQEYTDHFKKVLQHISDINGSDALIPTMYKNSKKCCLTSAA